jgi:hypothetical protein
MPSKVGGDRKKSAFGSVFSPDAKIAALQHAGSRVVDDQDFDPAAFMQVRDDRHRLRGLELRHDLRGFR